jgi:hypothetical protein
VAMLAPVLASVLRHRRERHQSPAQSLSRT